MDSEVTLYFLHMKDVKLPIMIILGHRGVWGNVKTGLFFVHFLQDLVIWSLFTENVSPRKKEWAEVLVRFIVFAKYMYM